MRSLVMNCAKCLAATLLVILASCATLEAQITGATGASAESDADDARPLLPTLPLKGFIPSGARIAEEAKRNGLPDAIVPPPAQASSSAPSSRATGYTWPSPRVRFRRYVLSMIGPFPLLGAGLSAAIDQAKNAPEEWRQGAKGYGKRYASNFGQNAIQQTVIYGLSEALRVDSHSYKSQRRGFLPRLKDALLENITSRRPSGRRVISIPKLAGYYVGGIVPATTWYPNRYSYKDGLRFGTYTLAIGFGVSVAREFIRRH